MNKAKKISGIIKKKTGAILLYVMLIPAFISTAVSLFGGDYIEFIIKGVSFALMALSAILVSRGISAEVDYEEAVIAKAPLPYKSAGAILLGLSVFISGFVIAHRSLIETLFVSLLAVAGVVMYYGRDIRADKIPQDMDVNPDILLQSLSEAKSKLKSIENHRDEIEDMSLRTALDRALLRAESIVDTIEENPSAIRMARKFLVVYVEGIEDVMKSYKEVGSDLIDSETRDRLITLLNEAEERFDKELQRLKESDKFELDVQIDALREQMRER